MVAFESLQPAILAKQNVRTHWGGGWGVWGGGLGVGGGGWGIWGAGGGGGGRAPTVPPGYATGYPVIHTSDGGPQSKYRQITGDGQTRGFSSKHKVNFGY